MLSYGPIHHVYFSLFSHTVPVSGTLLKKVFTGGWQDQSLINWKQDPLERLGFGIDESAIGSDGKNVKFLREKNNKDKTKRARQKALSQEHSIAI